MRIRQLCHSRWIVLPLAWIAAIPNWGAVPMYLAKDTPVELRLKQTLSSAAAKVNDRVEFEVSEDVRVGDYVVIPTGSLAWGSVVEAAPRSRMMKSGKLAIDIRGVCLASGKRAILRGSPSNREGLSARPTEDAPATNVLALPALPVLLFVYGKDVVIPVGHAVTAYVSEGVKINADEARYSTPNTTCEREQAPLQSDNTEPVSTLIIRSAPVDAELTIDGRYLGNAPSTVRLPPGDHVITAMAPGRKTWERTVRLAAGDEISITATLDARPPIGATNGPQPTAPAPVPATQP